jgi:hypothetical protein
VNIYILVFSPAAQQYHIGLDDSDIHAPATSTVQTDTSGEICTVSCLDHSEFLCKDQPAAKEPDSHEEQVDNIVECG